MDFDVCAQNLESVDTDCLVVGLYNDHTFTPEAARIDPISYGTLTQWLSHLDITGKTNQCVILPSLPNIKAKRIAIVGCGENKPLSSEEYLTVLQTAFTAIKNTSATSLICSLIELPVDGHKVGWKIIQAGLMASHVYYQFNKFKTQPTDVKNLKTFYVPSSEPTPSKDIYKALNQVRAIAKGIAFTKDLGNTPANICTPSYLADQAKLMSKTHRNISTSILNESQMKKLNMGALLSVAAGSKEEAKLIVIEYKGTNKKDRPIALVGKGITFDTGGISLKPGKGMEDMLYDMCGAASVMGTLLAVSLLNLPINVIGVVPCAENMPGGGATKPGDVVTTSSGQTVEIINTDAEGRLVLCDALTYCERFDPDIVIDIATLTGAIVVALGHDFNGLFCNHPPLAHALEMAAQSTHDHTWRMPLWKAYNKKLESTSADMVNAVMDGEAGSLIAANFLAKFTEKYHWAHLDVAGSAFQGGAKKAATGRPVFLLTQFLIDKCVGWNP